MKNKLLLIILSLSSFVLLAQNQKINVEKSTIAWTGNKLVGSHDGFIDLKEGSLTLKDGNIVSGNFIIDMNSMSNSDLKNENSNKKLIGHLKSDDFFGVASFPTASFKITESTTFEGKKANVTGALTIKGITKEISFDVVKKNKSYTGKMEIDRSKYNVKYGSSSFFDSLGDKAIDDIFILDINLFLD